MFAQIANVDYYNPLDVKVNLLFLEGHANWRSYNTNEMRYSLSKVDSAIALKPQAAYLYNLKGLMHISLKQFKEGQKALQKGISLAPNWLYPYHNLGSAYSQQFKFDSAYIFYKKALQIDSNYQTTFGGISNMYSMKGNIDSAMYWSKAGLKKDSTDPVLWAQLGYGYLNKEKWKQALACFHNSMHYEPALLYANEGALRVHMYDSKNVDSVAYYVTKLIASDSLNPVVYENMGNIFTEFNEFDDALRMFDISLAIDSLNPETWKDVGLLYSKMGKDTIAINAFNHAWNIDSTDANTYNMMANAYFNLQQYADAKYLYGKAIEYNPGNAVLYTNCGMAAEWGGEKETGEGLYKKALEIDTAYSPAYYRLASLYADSKVPDAVKNLALAIKYGKYTKAIAKYDGPVYLRFGRPVWPIFTKEEDFIIGKAQVLNEGKDISIFACGHLVWKSVEAARILEEKGISVDLINIHTIKPLDVEAVMASIKKTGCAVTAEEHNIIGGLGDSIAQVAAKNWPIPIEYVGTNDTFGESGTPTELLTKYGLDTDFIVAAAEKALARKK
ncbi:MAG: tetratricopeptide repeat protein [Chitinophagaceae bacterium]|nr:MAG: tetratricopeptide repeat protein [Chitinophagaceae bacterium]